MNEIKELVHTTTQSPTPTNTSDSLTTIKKKGLMDKNVARKLFNPLFYLPLQLFEKMNKKFAFTVVAK